MYMCDIMTHVCAEDKYEKLMALNLFDTVALDDSTHRHAVKTSLHTALTRCKHVCDWL